MIFLLSFFWFISETKAILFWLYLWQLKEYHIGRFIDHFRTEKGKKIFFNYILLLKIILVFIFLQFLLGPQSPCQKYYSNLFLSYFLTIIYFSESIKGFSDSLKKKLKIPVSTKKTVFLIFVIFLFKIFYFFSVFQKESFSFSLLIFDILTPAIVSGIVLMFQPFTALIRYQTIKKAKKKRESFKNLTVIGITGSYGKTSTKEFLATILSQKFKVLKTKEHQNSEVGISQCILNDLNENHEIFVVEMGAYNRGGIKLLSDIAKPKIGILTGINEQHMSTFGSQENIIKTKYELIESLPKDGLAIFNGSDPHTTELYLKTDKQKRIYSIGATADHIKTDIFAQNIEVKKDFINFKVSSKKGEKEDFKIAILGAQNIPNLLAAILVARELGMSFEEIKKACQKIKPEQGGIKLLKGKNSLNVLDATYSANPDGVVSHLEYLKLWTGKKVIIMPCLIELGSATEKVHFEIGKAIGNVCDLAIVTTKDKFEEIKEGATLSVAKPSLSGGVVKSGMPEENILFLENPKQIVEKIKTFCRPEDVILLEGRIPREVIELLIK
jgi:UDP-N-acetylmuramoyl-tripeptide--D-alanyl-D-alanine ligase